MIDLTTQEFNLFKDLIYKDVGIKIQTKEIFKNKLSRALRKHNTNSYSYYYNIVVGDDAEKEEMINVVTTNETYFFREKKQFDFLEQHIVPLYKNRDISIWSAASSLGAEAYSLSMLLHKNSISHSIFASDINTEVIEQAKKGTYPLKWLDKIPSYMQTQYCKLKEDSEDFHICNCIKNSVHFAMKNLIHEHNNIGSFDIIFLRNVLIYFDDNIKQIVLTNILNNLKVGGFLFISVTEHIDNLNISNLKQIESSIFKKVA